jgi:FAD:protein FMN transferase
MTAVSVAPTWAPPIATPRGMHRVGFAAMGTTVDVLLPAGRETAVATVVSTFDSWMRRCSRFDPTSELSRLNAAAGRPVIVSPGLFHAISTAMDAARATGGVFDPTILGRLRALGYDRTFSEVRDHGAAEPFARPSLVERWADVLLDRTMRTVELPEGVGLDLGGIAKGMAVDEAVLALAEAGVAPAAVNAGGDLAVLGTPPDADGWRIAIETPDGEHVVVLRSGALATSSTTRRRWTRGGRDVHHLIDPRTGAPADTGIASVSVSALRCAQAEVAAKAVLILGPRPGADLIVRTGLSALVVEGSGRRHRIGQWVDAEVRPARPGDPGDRPRGTIGEMTA